MTDEADVDLGDFADLLADPSLWVEPPSDLEDRVVAAVVAEMSAPVVVSAASVRARRSRGRRWAVPFLVGAAAASVAIGVASVALRDAAPTSDATVTLDVGPAAPPGVSAGTARLRVTRSGLRIEVSSASLPGLLDGAVYACWVKTAAGLQTCGAFHTGGNRIVLWSGVRDLAVVEAISITLEPAGDQDPGSSGQRVLFGELEVDGSS